VLLRFDPRPAVYSEPSIRVGLWACDLRASIFCRNTAILAIGASTDPLALPVRDRGNEPTAADLVAKYAWRPSAELARMIEQLQAEIADRKAT
jgi:hypothetical protein